MARKHYFRIAGLLFAASIIVFVYWIVFIRSEHKCWTESVRVNDSLDAVVHFEHTAKPYLSFGHAGGMGGGDDRYSLNVDIDGRHFKWQGKDERPFVLRFHKMKLYMVSFDRTDINRICFRYYASDADGILQEIPFGDFPKSVAVQNAWLKKEDISLLKEMDPKNIWFRNSLTCRMWLHLEKGIDYSQNKTPSEEFLLGYKDKYISPDS